MEITLRAARPEDEAFLFEVYASTRRPELAALDWSDEMKEAFLRSQAAAQQAYYQEHYPTSEFLIIERNREAVGRYYLGSWEDEFRLIDIALLPAARGEGIGRRLIESLLEKARISDKPVRLHVERENPALRLYDRLGFRQIEDRGVYLFLEWLAPTAPRAS